MAAAGSTDAYRPFVPRLALEWDAAAPGARGRTLDASLLGLDVSGFTALSERLSARGKLGAEELIRLISSTYAALIEIADDAGGDVLKFRGDALLILFEGDGHERRAAQAALGMQSYIASAGTTESTVGPVKLAMAAGLVSGPCDFFLVGLGRRELIVCGPSASATLALEDAAEAGEILVSPRTAAALEGVVGSERDGAFLLRPDARIDAPSVPTRARSAASDLAQFLPPPLRDAIAAGAVEAEHRHVTAAFLKFSGTDRLVARQDQAAVELHALAEVVTEVTGELGITWLESDIDRDGGKLYLVAGAPSGSGDDEERMLRGLRAIVDAGSGMPVAVGVNRGAAVTGPIGSASRRTYAVMGSPINLAARLAARADKGEILSTGEVLQRSRSRFETTSRQFLMKGKEKPVTGYALGAPASVDVEVSRPQLPLVGRETEVAALRDSVDAVRLRESRAVEIVGEAGSGKSRLLDELTTIAVGFQILRAQCGPYSAATPFALFRTLLRPLIGVLPDESPEDAGVKLAAFTQAVMPDLAPWLPLLALPFDAVVPPTAEVDEIDALFRRDRLHDVLDTFLTRLLLMPTALVAEDTHWLDDASQLLLTKLGRAAPRPWLSILTRRPTAPELWGGTVLELAPLAAEDARTLALAAAGDTVLSEEQLAAVTERAAGNPLFVRELAAAPAEEGALPETVESLLEARIDTLDPRDRLLLRHASVIGPTFDLDLLFEILPDEVGDPELWARLSEFVDWDDASVLRFRHELVRVAAYEGLSYARRQEIHLAVAAALERRSGDPHASAEILSLHFLAAGVYEKAWSYAVIAGDDARAKYANVDASTAYRRAIAASGGWTPPKDEIIRVTEALGDVLELAAHYDDADSAYAQCLELGGDRARLLRKRGVVSERRGRYDQALESYELAAPHADAAEGVALQLGRAIVLYRQGRIEESAEVAELAADAALALGDRAALADAYYVRAAAEGDRGGPAQDFLDRAFAIFEELGLVHRQATVLNNMGVRAYYEGDWARAGELYLRSEEAMQRAGDVLTGGHAANNRAEILLDQGRLVEAAELFDGALRTYRAAKFPLGEALVTLNLGRLAGAEGRFDDAHARFDDAAELLAALGSESFLIEADARRAEAYVLEGRHDDAASLAAEALDGLSRTGEIGVRKPLLERALGLAAVQSRKRDDASPHFERSLQAARELGAEYEIARTLDARVATGLALDGEAEEARAIMQRLGVVAIPDVPLP
jgi:class 3 adenylate cyclase/tetratricopeptide (TPR) repeat protein